MGLGVVGGVTLVGNATPFSNKSTSLFQLTLPPAV